MEITLHTDVPEFVRYARPFYEADPVAHTGALTALANVERTGKWAVLVTVRDRGELCGVMIGDGDRPAGVSGLPVAAAAPVAAALSDAGVELTAVSGPREPAEAFGDAWSRVTGGPVRQVSQQWLYVLDSLAEPRRPRGEFRVATAADIPRIARWRVDFTTELEPVVTPDEDSAEVVRVAMAQGGVHGLWCVDGNPVSMALGRAPEGGVSRISFVYSPPGQRGHGYASAVTAAVTRQVLDNGVRNVVLHADANNPVANAIYQRLGFLTRHQVLRLAFPVAKK
ncbi:GNAT family N-acetyltransferase [Amycolatopsis anabasis]|uniref:GNAT family N-acetyltransferase n=1 Tax=Amycolatopsis anabasis TaxID=1840409 RepID=UPI00131AB9BC|nr:GNAT family N-acetyltransferase [Amycolatopsis anabasis]